MPKSLPTPLMGEVWDAQFSPAVGAEQLGIRPALVLSSGWFNTLDHRLVVVVPITGTDRKIRYQVTIDGREGGLSKNSVIMSEQIRSMDRSRFLRKRGRVSPETLAEVRRIVALIVGEEPPAQ
ncbi:MAG: type II toxin-antitoxin system PemK/MazF family toxin [Thermomicrobiales bacterium]